MLVTLERIEKDDRALLERLVQLYLYDFSEFEPSDVGDDGRFSGWIDAEAMFAEPLRSIFLIKVDDAIAGFATVCERSEAFRDPAEKVLWLEEFFVMRRFRRSGVGERAAVALFERFRGTWEVGEIRSNVVGQSFWRHVIGRYTAGDFTEIQVCDDRWDGPIQYFTSS